MQNKIILYYLAILIGSQLKIGLLYIAFVAYVFLLRLTSGQKPKWSAIQIQFFMILIIGITLSVIYVTFNTAAYRDMESMIFSNRKFLIEITFAIALYEYLRYQSMDYIIKMLFVAIVLNAVAGTVQLGMHFPQRIWMLFPEPSAAGYFYLFVFFILLSKMNKPKTYNIVSKYFMILGLAIGSKAQIILLFIVGILKYFTPLKIFAYIVTLGVIISIFKEQLMGIDVIKYNLMVLDLYLDKGLAGLRIDNGVWGTYVTRVSAIQGALICMLEHPFGIGFGSFNSWFPENMVHAGFSSPETDKILDGIYYASPKSNLLNFFVSTGIFGIGFYIYWFKQFFAIRKEQEYLFQSFIILSLASTFIELNPMYAYFMFLFILKEKEEKKKSKY